MVIATVFPAQNALLPMMGFTVTVTPLHSLNMISIDLASQSSMLANTLSDPSTPSPASLGFSLGYPWFLFSRCSHDHLGKGFDESFPTMRRCSGSISKTSHPLVSRPLPHYLIPGTPETNVQFVDRGFITTGRQDPLRFRCQIRNGNAKIRIHHHYLLSV